MGLNIVLGCELHRERMWIYRGHEGPALVAFYEQHKSCSKRNALRISDDQAGGWAESEDEGWTEKTYPAD